MTIKVLPILTFHIAGEDTTENPQGQSGSDTDITDVDRSDLVASNHEHGNGGASDSTSKTIKFTGQTERPEVELTRMEVVGCALKYAGFEDEVINMVDRAWGNSPASDSHWRIFTGWCKDHGINSQRRDEVVLANFLATKVGYKKQTVESFKRTIHKM
eukprot:TRINITY_DN6762_c0_g2_i14.p1 TRINITY_DN6762_c0_g2~~TRINITY_DN6762_c0_g2_i14.p1  ORF type:complete len:158 (-),score=29.01 TRINITY_DN6762_c0_g2_i14:997-1470(-)